MFIEDDSHDFAAWVLHRLMSREGGEGGAREGGRGGTETKGQREIMPQMCC